MKRIKITSFISLAVFLFCFGILPFTSPFEKGQAAAATTFTDIRGHWAEGTILWATEQGIVNGFTDGTFKPNQRVTEAQFLAMVIRAYRSDVVVQGASHWTDPFYQLGGELNYPVSGTTDSEKRNEYLLRVQVAELIAATQGVNYHQNDAIKYVLGYNLAKGTNPNHKTVLSYQGSKSLTRAEAVTFIENLVLEGKDELAARPAVASDPNLLPNIPIGNEEQLTISYQAPNNWTAPVIQATATEDYNRNKEVLEKELHLLRGIYFNPYGGSQIERAEVVVEAGGDSYIAQITFYNWYGSHTGAHQLNKIPYIAKELFKFYLPYEHGNLYTIIDNHFNKEDISTYVNKPMELDGRQIHIVTSPFSVSVRIGTK
ncbi:S-layer homology domain-containing protein [Bacillus horti]|uniref:SLH domain-containing protein n=1 Tax=Caldalkalibacillus horti TaxID=77523 RepID=A0ABT9W232_9BACI|nr:S-layer homology domain-containing protein [Bacillus horti]MDQ0167298.1 hypothetical protein [Bacillus horti]